MGKDWNDVGFRVIGVLYLVAEFISLQKVYTFSSIGEYGIPKSVKCAHSATKDRVWSLGRASGPGFACRTSVAPKSRKRWPTMPNVRVFVVSFCGVVGEGW